MSRLFRVIAISLGWAVSQAMAGAPQAPGSGPVSTNMPLKQVGPGIFDLGKVRLNKQQRTITFPAVLNMDQALIEYLLVTSQGKIHESLLRTDAEPWHIHTAMLLLGAKGAGTNSLPQDPTRPLPGEKVRIDVAWQINGKEKRYRAEELVYDRARKSVMRRGPWIYFGSRIREGVFVAQRDGSVVSLIEDEDALINNPRPGRDNDDNWQVRAKGLPPVETPVQVTIRLEAP